jgi:hypothetical protein
MRTTLWLGVLLSSSSLLAACGDNKDPTEADARIVSDAPPGSIDAPDDDPDAGPPADAAPGFECNGVPIPTVAETELTISGNVGALSTSGTVLLEDVPVEAYVTGVTDPVAETMSGTNGVYSMTIPNPGATPADGYIRANAGGSYKITYVYPPTLLYTDLPTAAIRTLDEPTFVALNALLGSPQEVDNGLVAVVVTNCAGEPVEGATVSSPQSTIVRYNGAGGLPSGSATATAADGIAYVFNIPPGNATIDAEYEGVDFREHTVVVYSIGMSEDNSLTTTTIIP